MGESSSTELELSRTITLFLPLLIFTQLLCAYVEANFPKLMHVIPEVGLIILTGILVGLLLHVTKVEADISNFSPTLFFVGLLPPIIFHSGFHLKRHLFFTNGFSILVFAVLGTLLSAAIVSYGMYYFSSMGLIDRALTHAECWTFGALISATDPVSTLVLFAELRVEPHLFYLVFGESVMNDAVGIVLFETASQYISDGSDPNRIPDAIGFFVLNLFGSLFMGVLLTVIMSIIIKRSHLRDKPVLEQGLFVIFIYLPFVVGEACSLSGIVTTLTAAMATRKFLFPTMNEYSQERAEGVLRMISQLMEVAAFLNLGLCCVTTHASAYSGSMIVWAIILCLVSRPIQIYLFSRILNWTPIPHKLDAKTQHMMAFSGLRGVVAFACVNRWPSDEKKSLFMATTSMVVLFTVFVQGGLTYKMLQWLEIEMGVDENTPHDKQTGLMRWLIDKVDRHVTPYVNKIPFRDPDDAASILDGVDNESLEDDAEYRGPSFESTLSSTLLEQRALEKEEAFRRSKSTPMPPPHAAADNILRTASSGLPRTRGLQRMKSLYGFVVHSDNFSSMDSSPRRRNGP